MLENRTYNDSIDRNSNSFQEEMMKLDAWEEDQKQTLMKSINDIKNEMEEKRKESLRSTDNSIKIQLRNESLKLEEKHRKMLEDYFKQSKDIEDKKRELLHEIEDKMQA